MSEERKNFSGWQLYLRGNVWWFRMTTPQGKWIRKSTKRPVEDLNNAKKIGETWYRMTTGDIDPSVFLTLHRVIDSYLEYSRGSLKSHPSNISRASRLKEYFPKSMLLSNLKIDDLKNEAAKTINGFVRWIKEGGIKIRNKQNKVSNAAVNRYLALLKAAIERVIKSGGWNGENVLKKMKFGKEVHTPTTLDPGQIVKIFKLAVQMREEANLNKGEYSKYYFLLFCAIELFTGLRAGTILNIKPEHVKREVSTDQMYFEIPAEITKTDRPGKKYITNFIKKVMELYPNEGRDFLIDTKNKSRESCTFAKCRWRIKKEAGIEMGTHDLRRTFATNMVPYLDLPSIQQVLDHTNIETTMRYILVTPSIDALHAAEKFADSIDLSKIIP